MTGALRVLRPGPFTTVQDLGRPGRSAWGVPTSGAADRAALRLANRLVGNPEGAAALEVTLGGLQVRPDVDVVVALTGAPAPATVAGRPVPPAAPLRVPAGAVVTLGTPAVGLRSYLAVRGGIEVAPVLGSRSTDVLAGLGPSPLAGGDELPLGRADAELPPVDVAPVPPPPAGDVVLPVRWGPRDDRFTDVARRALLDAAWTVTGDTNRVAARLDGPTLPRRDRTELPSEGLVRGALQVPPTGRPVLFLADHPVTGGYPVIAVVLDAATDRAAQLRPGQRIRFAAT